SPYDLGSGESATVIVRFSPTSATSFFANVTFSGGGGTTSVVSGIGTSSGCTLAVGPLSLNLGDVKVGRFADAMIAVQNEAGAPEVSGTASITPGPPYSITSN